MLIIRILNARLVKVSQSLCGDQKKKRFDTTIFTEFLHLYTHTKEISNEKNANRAMNERITVRFGDRPTQPMRTRRVPRLRGP